MPDVKPVPRWLRAANRAALALSRAGLTMGPVCVPPLPAELAADAVPEILGRPALTFAAWARDHAADFR